MSDTQFYQTRLGQQFYGVTMPELVRQIHRLNDMLALAVELMEKQAETDTEEKDDDRPGHG